MVAASMWIVTGVAIYALFIILHGVGIFRFSKERSAADYFLAGRTIGPLVLLATVSVSIFSGLAVVGFPAATYRLGVGYYSANFGHIFGLLFVVIGYRMWILAKQYGFITPSDFFRARFYSEGYGLFVALVYAIFLLPYIALQIIVLGNSMEVISEGAVPYLVAIAFAVIIVAIHVYLGGMRSVAWLDTFHAVLGYSVFFIMIVYLLRTYFPGGMAEVAAIVRSTYPEVMSHPGPAGTFDWRGVLNLGMTGSVAIIVWPHIFVRLFVARSKHIMRFVGVFFPLMQGAIFIMMVGIGWSLAPALLGPGFADPDSIIPHLALNYTPTILAFFIMLGIAAFCISTADSQVLVGGSIIGRDIYQRHIAKTRTVDTDKVMRISRLAVIAMMIIVLWITWEQPIYIVDYAYTLSSPFFGMMLPAMVGGLFWPRATKEGAIAGTAIGLLTVFVLTFFVPAPLGLSALVWGMVINSVIFIVVSLLSPPVPEDVRKKYIDIFQSVIYGGSEVDEANGKAIVT